jgi:pimeloyl-ACP methyl ester carboxylesterase
MRDEVRTIASGDLELSVRVSGDGPLVILMHGWPELGLSWRHQIEPLAAAGFSVAAPDMRGFGGSSKPADVAAYNTDDLADDMAAIAATLQADKWVAVGHDWGSPVAWRCALRFPEQVVAVFSLSVPYFGPPPPGAEATFDAGWPDGFFYVRYFQQVGPPEAELESDVRSALEHIYFALSGEAPQSEWIKPRPRTSRLRDDLAAPPPGPLPFMPDEILDQYAAAFKAGGFFGPISWYRNLAANATQAASYGEGRIEQPSGFLCGDKEIVLAMQPGSIERQRPLLGDLRVETILPGAGHWIQQERPAEVTSALLGFLDQVFPDR